MLLVLAAWPTVVPMLLAIGKVWDQREPLTESHPLGQNDGSWDNHIIQDLLRISHTTTRTERGSVCLSNRVVVEIKGDNNTRDIQCFIQ